MQFIVNAALSCGLDSAVLLKDIQTKATDLFNEDLELAKAYEVTSFPTLLFSNDSGNKTNIKGIQSYEKFEEIIKTFIPGVVKKKIQIDPLSLFKLYNIMTEHEFCFFYDIDAEKAQKLLRALHKQGEIERAENKNGFFWKYTPSQ